MTQTCHCFEPLIGWTASPQRMVPVPGSTHDNDAHDTFIADRLVVLSATYRDLPTDARERLAATLPADEPSFVGRVVLHTCHRVELIGILAGDGHEPQLPGVRVFRGAEAAERVFIVAGGLDSAVFAEEQVLGQVRAAYENVRAAGATGPVLDELLQRAIRFGKRVRSELQPRTDRNLADHAVGWIRERLGVVQGPNAALVIGTGEMGTLLATSLAADGMRISVASRSLERAEGMIAGLAYGSGHRAVGIEQGLLQAGQHAVVAIAVRSAAMPLDAPHLATHPLPLVVDLSAPPAVSPAAAELLADRLVDLDRLGALPSARQLSHAAERRLRASARQAALEFVQWWAQRSSGDGIATLHAHAAQIRERHLDRLRRRSDLTPGQLAAVESATAAMLGELLHAPTIRLQSEAEAREVVARVFGLDS